MMVVVPTVSTGTTKPRKLLNKLTIPIPSGPAKKAINLLVAIPKIIVKSVAPDIKLKEEIIFFADKLSIKFIDIPF